MVAGLASVNLDPVARLLAACVGGDGVIVLDADGAVVLRLGVGEDETRAVLDSREAEDEAGTRRAAGRLVHERDLRDPAVPSLGTLLLLSDDAAAGGRADAAAACLAQYATQAVELDDMAIELATRYEELNLLYTLDERRAGYDPERGHDALRQMVVDCSGFLDVGLSCLHAPAEHLDLRTGGAEDDGALAAQWTALCPRLLTLVTERNVATVINTPAEWRAVGLEGEPPGKVLLVPLRHADGQVCGLLCTLNPEDADDFSNSDRKLLEVLGEQASRIIQGSYDPVTGLLNRHGFGHRATAMMERERPERISLLHLNLDAVRMVNDSAGRRAGDAMLRRVAGVLARHEPEGGALGHLGGDEFVLLFAGGESLQQVRRSGATLQAALAADGFSFEGKRFDISACAGVAEGQESMGLQPVMARADAACRVAKSYGRGQLRVYDPTDERYLDRQRQAAWGPRIIEALAAREFVLYAQPIVPVSERAGPPHYEVLVRLPEPDGHVAAPGAFLGAAERYGLMPRLDRQVLSLAVEFMSVRLDCAPLEDFVLAVNVSGQSLADGDFLTYVLDTVTVSAVPFNRLCFEVTETAAIADFDAAIRFIHGVRSRGSTVALDDFGSGLSSFGYLRRLPVDYLKIDGQIVRAIADDPINAAMVDSIHRIGRVMGIATIAEFVENAAMMNTLRDIGVDYAQGYGIARPRPIGEAVPGGDDRAELPVVVGLR